MKNSFMSGAIILMSANIISKILGAILKIPLTYIMHEEGMAVYNTAFGVYVMFLSFVISGMPFAVQKLTAEAHARGDRAYAKSTVRTATLILGAVGAAGTVVLWFGADFFALAMKEERAVYAIRAIAPSVLLVALGAAVKSGFQGESNMLPTAVSQVIESFIKLFAGYGFAVLLLGLGTRFAAAGAAAGVTAGELIATLILVIWYMIASRHDKCAKAGQRDILNSLLSIALPMLFMSVAGSAVSVCDTSLLRMSLIQSGLTPDDARFVYGAYTGYALTVLNLPAGFLATIGVSIIPVISGAAAMGNDARIRKMSIRAILLSFFAGVAATAVLAVFGELILKLLFHNTYSAPMLRMAAPSVVFICVMQVCASILQSLGRMWRAFAASIAAALIKLAFTVLLASRPELGIYGAIIGADIAYFIGMALNLAALAKRT